MAIIFFLNSIFKRKKQLTLTVHQLLTAQSKFQAMYWSWGMSHPLQLLSSSWKTLICLSSWCQVTLGWAVPSWIAQLFHFPLKSQVIYISLCILAFLTWLVLVNLSHVFKDGAVARWWTLLSWDLVHHWGVSLMGIVWPCLLSSLVSWLWEKYLLSHKPLSNGFD